MNIQGELAGWMYFLRSSGLDRDSGVSKHEAWNMHACRPVGEQCWTLGASVAWSARIPEEDDV